jgi:hypothetical protein
LLPLFFRWIFLASHIRIPFRFGRNRPRHGSHARGPPKNCKAVDFFPTPKKDAARRASERRQRGISHRAAFRQEWQGAGNMVVRGRCGRPSSARVSTQELLHAPIPVHPSLHRADQDGSLAVQRICASATYRGPTAANRKRDGAKSQHSEEHCQANTQGQTETQMAFQFGRWPSLRWTTGRS